MGTYNLFMLDLIYIDDICSGQFLDLPIISQCGQISWFIFHNILVGIADSTMPDISRAHPGISRRNFGYVTAMRSWDVIKHRPPKCFSFANSIV